ncbi:MAG: cupredoxin domain-containing protein [Alphaproteobacteria bacterium]
MKSNSLHNAIGAFAISLFSVVPVYHSLAAEGQDDGHGHAGMSAKIGEPGEPSQVTRTIEIVMHDNYYEPEDISVKEGETVRFIIRNKGVLVHEFNIATSEMHAAHAPEMMMMQHGVLEPDKINWDAAKAMQESMGHGMHEEANSILLEPGKSGEIIWTFPDHTELEFACNVPGHYDSGMVGDIDLTH